MNPLPALGKEIRPDRLSLHWLDQIQLDGPQIRECLPSPIPARFAMLRLLVLTARHRAFHHAERADPKHAGQRRHALF
ncbi:MAG: hypothetical protein DWI28_00405 [Planctomycetota bacterium]|nr:MAG: hypothetical protein DWI28_00405 [Planctomycetota bacterium]